MARKTLPVKKGLLVCVEGGIKGVDYIAPLVERAQTESYETAIISPEKFTDGNTSIRTRAYSNRYNNLPSALSPDCKFGIGFDVMSVHLVHAFGRFEIRDFLRLELSVNDLVFVERYISHSLLHLSTYLGREGRLDYWKWAGQLERGKSVTPDITLFVDVLPNQSKLPRPSAVRESAKMLAGKKLFTIVNGLDEKESPASIEIITDRLWKKVKSKLNRR